MKKWEVVCVLILSPWLCFGMDRKSRKYTKSRNEQQFSCYTNTKIFNAARAIRFYEQAVYGRTSMSDQEKYQEKACFVYGVKKEIEELGIDFNTRYLTLTEIMNKKIEQSSRKSNNLKILKEKAEHADATITAILKAEQQAHYEYDIVQDLLKFSEEVS